nr:redoxin domain-containing protein [Pseudopedobacter sp.]
MLNNKFLKVPWFVLILVIVSYIAKGSTTDTLKLGQKVMGFSLHNVVEGEKSQVSLEDYKNKKGVIVVFMTNGCYHCILYCERIKAFQKDYAAKGYQLITINPSNPTYAKEETTEEMIKNAKKEKYDFPYLQDFDQKIAYAYGVRYTPEVFVLKREGKDWFLKYSGPIDNDMENKKKDKISYVKNVMKALLSNQKVPEYDVIK